jgi:hypothetical protein
MSSTAIEVGDDFIFDGVGCRVTDVGGKTGKQLLIAPVDPDAAPFDTVTVSLAEAVFHDVLRIWCLPTRILAKTPRTGLVTITPESAEG